MRTPIIAAAILVAPTLALAQSDEVARPEGPAPAATAAFEQRETWCAKYTTWLVANTPAPAPRPADVRASQHFEVEFNACKLDPQEYESDTRAEANEAEQSASG